jgi:hypothetical protein
MIAFFAVFVHHVPSYSADHNCHHLPHGPTTSQVAYLRGSGGVEYDLHEVMDEPVFDFNFVFRNEIDTSTISLYVGCGGCASERPFHWDEPLSLPLDLPTYYHPAKFEPFTQHAYYELLPEHARKLYTTTLRNCSSHHMSARLIVHGNATEEIVWGAVVGCPEFECERFTALEYLSFPIYVLRNHGPTWNNAGWSIYVFALLVPVLMALIFWWWWEGWLVFYVPVGPAFPRMLARMRPGTRWASLKGVCWEQSFRLFLYAVATWAIVVDLLETLFHFAISVHDVPREDQGLAIFWFWYGLKWLLLVLVGLSWMWAREIPESKWRGYHWRIACAWDDGLGPFSPFWAHGFWSLAEIPFGLASLFIGAGFYVYPVAITLAGLVRLVRWIQGPPKPAEPCKSTIYVPTETEDTGCGYQHTPGLFMS